MRIWSEMPTTMVFVTHSIEEAVLMGDRIVVLGVRPGGIREIIDVPIARPRDREVLRTEQFSELRQYVWDLVMGESATQPDADALPG